MSEQIAIQLTTGRVFANPNDTVYTQFYPGGGLTPAGLWLPFSLDENGNLLVSNSIGSQTAILTVVPSSISSVQVVAANPDRTGLILYNNSSSICFIAFSSTASPTLFTEFLEPGSTFALDQPIYLGHVSAIWESANGSLQVTEF